MTATLLVLVLALCCPPAEPTLAFVGVNVVPMSSETVLADQTVVVRGDRIVELGPAAMVAVPADATRIDGHGRWLMPGLADMHVHTWSPDDFPLFLANGVTTVRNMFGSELQLDWRRQIAAGELLGPTILRAGPIIDDDPPVWPGCTVLTDPALAEQVVLDQQAAASKTHGIRLLGQVPNAVGLEGVIDSAQASIEHLDGFADAAQLPDSPFVGKPDFRSGLQGWKQIDDARVAEFAQRCSRGPRRRTSRRACWPVRTGATPSSSRALRCTRSCGISWRRSS